MPVSSAKVVGGTAAQWRQMSGNPGFGNRSLIDLCLIIAHQAAPTRHNLDSGSKRLRESQCSLVRTLYEKWFLIQSRRSAFSDIYATFDREMVEAATGQGVITCVMNYF